MLRGKPVQGPGEMVRGLVKRGVWAGGRRLQGGHLTPRPRSLGAALEPLLVRGRFSSNTLLLGTVSHIQAHLTPNGKSPAHLSC